MRVRRLLRVGLLLPALGMMCLTTRRAQQGVDPPPPDACVAEALASSPQVLEVQRESLGADRATFHIALRDSTSTDGRRYARVQLDDSERPAAALTVYFSWPGIQRIPGLEERAVFALGASLLGHLQRACAPGARTAALCDRLDGKWKPCVPAA